MTLTFLCVTSNGQHARPFIERMAADAETLGAAFVLALDGQLTLPWMRNLRAEVHEVSSGGYLESVLDTAVALCPDGYILRLDDDERLSADALAWLSQAGYRMADHWAFRRANLWPDEQHRIANEPLWPDLQTRLSTKAKSGGRSTVHVGSPYGTGTIAPGFIEHHKFLVRPRDERERLVDHYEQIQPGAGRAFSMFSLPEKYADDLVCEAL